MIERVGEPTLLVGFCMRCKRYFAGPDEGCPCCDSGKGDVTSARNYYLSDGDAKAKLAGPDSEGTDGA